MLKKLPGLIFFCIFLCSVSSAQSYKYLYYLDNNLASTSEPNAVFIGKGIPENGQVRVDYFYKNANYLIMSIHFTDSSLSNMTGVFKSFFVNGQTENEGSYDNGLEQGVWIKSDSLGNKTDSSVYEKGWQFIHAGYMYDKNGKLNSYEFSDSIKKKYRYTIYDELGIKLDAEFTGDTGLLKKYDKDGIKTTIVLTKEKKEASFPGGDMAYRRFLQQSLDPNTPVENGAPGGYYSVIVKFVVHADGTIGDVIPETHLGYGMEAAVVRLIKNGPPWNPATIFGVPVVSYRRQPVTFVVDDGSGNKRN